MEFTILSVYILLALCLLLVYVVLKAVGANRELKRVLKPVGKIGGYTKKPH